MGAFSLPTSGFSQRDPQALRNPILDELDAAANNAHAQLSPQAQEALKRAGAPVPQAAAQPEAPRITNPRPAPPSIAPIPLSPAGQAQSAELARITAPPPSDPSLIHTHANTGTSGVNQIHNPWARVPLQIAQAVGAGFAPGLTQAIPGTDLHHRMLVGETEGALKQQQGIRKGEEEAQTAASTQTLQGAQSENLGGEQPLHEAQTAEAQARAYSLMHPETQKGEAGKTVQTDQGVLQLNPETGRYDIFVGGVPSKEGGTVHQLDDGSLIIAKPDGKAVAVTVDGKPVKGKAQTTGESTDVKNYQFAKDQGYAGSFEQWQKDEANRKTPKPPGESGTGTWTLQEGRDGKPVLFNSKSGETRPAPEGLQPRGTAAKDAPTKDAIAYAETYLKSGKFTGSGDEALMDQFFAAAKPKRMNAQQNELLMHSRDLVQGARAQAKHLFTPNAPYFDDEQRQTIVDTIRALANSQGVEGAPESAGGGGIPKVGDTFQGGKVTKITPIK